MNHRKPLDKTACAMMVVLCLVWSLQQIAVKAVAHSIAPMMQIALRSGAAFVLVTLLMLWRKERFDWSCWRSGAVIGFLFGLEYVGVGEALRRTSAGHTVVFLYTAPVFAAIGLHLKLPSERLSVTQWCGIGLSFCGVAYAFWGGAWAKPGSESGANVSLLGDALALMGGAAWGATTVVIRSTRLSNTAPNQTLLYQLGGAFLLLLPAAITPSTLVWASLAYQTFIMSFASLLAWFWLMRHYLASRLGVFTFLTPVMGVILGATLLGEPVEPGFVVGGVGVLMGIMAVSLHTAIDNWSRRIRAS